MSLRDQLLKAGVVDKKTVRKVNQELEAERRQHKGERQSRAEAEARAAAEAEAARLARQEAIIAARRAREREAEAAQAHRRALHLVQHYQLRTRGGNQPFWHLAPDRVHIHRWMLHERVVMELCQGRLGIGWHGDPEDPSYVLLPAEVARRALELDASRVLFFNQEPARRDDPAEQPYEIRG